VRNEENEPTDLANQLKASIADRLTAEQSLRDSLLERDRLIHEIEGLVNDRNILAERLNNSQTALNAALNSRAWRLAEKGRVYMRRFREDWPLLHQGIRALMKRKPAPAVQAAEAPKPQPSVEPAYQRWITESEPTAEELHIYRQSSESSYGPLISVIVPAHQTDPAMLEACMQSVVAQLYPHWQLCAAITPDKNPKNREYLETLAKQDPRIHLLDLPENGGISRNTNAALAQATGKFVAFLDHDDTLAPFALYEIAERIKTQPDVDILYSDHDYLDPEHGLRCNPLFKPAWSPSILFSANYLTHLTVLRRGFLAEVGPFDPATDGAQDWDLFLRATEKTNRIAHIPKILYHWRMHANSTAHNDSAKNYAADAQLLALRHHMQRLRMNAEPEVMPNGLLHVRFRNPPTAKVSIIIPTKDRLHLLSRCISTLLSITRYENFEILIVDNGSQETDTKEYFESLAKDARIRILWHPGPFNYSTVNNRAAREAAGEFFLFLNNDVEITHPEWLSELVSWANLPPVGIVGAKLLRANGSIQHAGVVLGMNGFADHPFSDGPSLAFGIAGSTGWYRDFLAVTGACMLMRREVFKQIGGFDENFVLCGSDVEICLRAHDHGYRIVLNPFAELIHHERQTRGENIPGNDFAESIKHYRRWILAGDPYWNPNLSPWSTQPAFHYRKQLSAIGRAEDHIGMLESEVRPTNATDAEVWVTWFDASAEQLERVRRHNSQIKGRQPVRRLLWFISPFDVPFYGGIYTILRLCDLWRRNKNVEISFAVCGAADRLKTISLIRQVYPAVADDQVFVLQNARQAADLPAFHATICTLWTTPYFALHHQNAGRRFYLIQDYEPAFYPAGSVSALVENTYRMGLYGIANTISLQRMYESEYGGNATYFTPRINAAVFHPAEPAPRPNPLRPLQVFCYGRPKHPRNAFELVKQAMRQLKERMGDRVRIVSAGDEWQPSDYGLQGIVENLGLLSYEDTARLYQESQVGVVMMLTRHPSYIPLELMACGCVAVTNINGWTSWLLKDSENCLLAPATATGISETVERALVDQPLREKIRASALEMVRSEYLDWSSDAEHIFNYLCDPSLG
jgi:GT2 family glycosyltransferase